MADTVFANGECVATTASGHNAHSTEPDVRLVNNKDPAPLKNYLETEFLAKDKSNITEFGGGKIWIEPTELGPPSKPVDTWPGKSNQGVKNGKITAQEGQGAKNVYVEGKKVLRHTDHTWQNNKNSQGIIDDAAGLDAYLKKKEQEVPPLPPDGGSGGAGDGDGTSTEDQNEEGEGEQGGEGEKDKDKEKDCEIEAVVAKHEKRKQSGSGKDKRAKLEVVPEGATEIELEAEFKGTCKEHPKWTASGKGWSAQGTEAKFPVDREHLHGFTTFGVWNNAFAAKAKTYVVTCTGHEGSYERQIDVYPPCEKEGAKNAIENLTPTIREIKEAIEKKFTAMLEKFDVRVEITTMKGSFQLEVAWKNSPSWKVYCQGDVKLELIIFEILLRKTYNLLTCPIMPPAISLSISLINALWQKLNDTPLIEAGPYIQFTGNLGGSLDFQKTYYPSVGEPKWACYGKATGMVALDVGIGVFISKNALKIEGRVRGSLSATGEPWVQNQRIGVKLVLGAAKLQGQIVLGWNFTVFFEHGEHTTFGFFRSWAADLVLKLARSTGIEISGEKEASWDLGQFGGWDFFLPL